MDNRDRQATPSFRIQTRRMESPLGDGVDLSLTIPRPMKRRALHSHRDVANKLVVGSSRLPRGIDTVLNLRVENLPHLRPTPTTRRLVLVVGRAHLAEVERNVDDLAHDDGAREIEAMIMDLTAGTARREVTHRKDPQLRMPNVH